MRVAIIGATGQLGSDLVKVFGSEAVPLSHAEIEVKDLSCCIKALEEHSPDVVINCAAYVRVDDAEDEAEEAFAVNAVGAKNVALACEHINAMNVYISTDYVFDGTKGKPYVESDLPNPINTYGLSKYAGEIFTRNYSSKYYIIRVSSLYGVKGARGKGGNFVETMIHKAKSGEEIKVVDDMIMSPTCTKDAAIAIKEIIGKKPPYGVYHATNSGSCSWYEFASAIFSFMNFDIAIKPITSRELNLKATRPENSSLESEKLEKYGIKLRAWKDALKDYLREKGYI
jgi:dTDP-4-dehydrorhamnose reductase